ncbi:MAG: DUF4139 domain-containing protein [Promethearchaeota archaeon]
MKIEDISVNHFPIVHVLLGEEKAIVTRQGELEVNEGITQFNLSRLTSKLYKESLHVTILETQSDVSLQAPMIRSVKPDLEPTQEVENLQKQLDEIQDQLSEIQFQLKNIEQKRTTSKTLLTKTGNEFLTQYSDDKVKIDQFVNLVTFVDKSFSDLREEELKLRNEEKGLEEKKNEFREKLQELQEQQEKEYNKLSFSLIVTQKGKIKLQIRYRVPARWIPSYDLKITGDQTQLFFWSIIENHSEENWNNIKLELLYSNLDEVSVAHPAPLPLERAIEGKLDTSFQQFKQEKFQIKGQTTEALTPLDDTISVPADGETHGYLMYSFSAPAKIFYYWNAAETDYIVIGVEFTNGEIDLLPGDCSFFREGKIIGRGKLPNLMSRKSIQLPLAVETSIIATKRLMKQENPEPKRILLHYKLQLVNQRPLPVTIEIMDVLPVSKQPKSNIQLFKSEPRPSYPSEGLLKWVIDLQKGWEANYTVEILEKKD